MVFFVCEGCNETLKKNQVDKHAGHCLSCWAVTCVDCNVTFPGDEYRAHTSCISEAQRYEGKLYKAPKQKVKRNPQEIWTQVVEDAVAEAASAPAALRSFIGNLNGYGNVPRNEKKFGNFVKNSLNVRSDKTIKDLWDYLVAKQKAAQDEQVADQASAAAAASGGGEGGGSKRRKDEDEGKEVGDGASAERNDVSEPKKAKKGKCEKKDKGVGNAGAEDAGAAWVAAITAALKAAPGKAMEKKALRKAVARAVAERKIDGDDGVAGKAEAKALFKAALKAHPKAAEAAGVVTYGKKAS